MSFEDTARWVLHGLPPKEKPKDDLQEVRGIGHVLAPPDEPRGIADALTPKEKQTVTIYVRKGDHAKERIISINPIPAGVEPIDLLDAGFALDGNSATLSVDAYTYVTHHHGEHALGMRGLRSDLVGTHVVSFDRWVPGGAPPGDWAVTYTLTKAVNVVETALVDWLQGLGYEVKFG